MISRALILFAFAGCIQCQDVVQNLTCDEIIKFVNGHNLRRELLVKGKLPGQPAATEMTYLVWDEELAAKASDWASQFRKLQHNPSRVVASKRFRTGENLAWFEATYEPDVITMSLDAWFNEYKDFTYGPITWAHFRGSKQIAHYTQMAWADTKYLGCAVYTRKSGKYTHFNVVCNYGKGGNIITKPPYKSGPPGKILTCSKEDYAKVYGDHC